MTTLSRFALAVSLTAVCGGEAAARNRRGDALLEQAKRVEAKDSTVDLEAALRLAQEALATDPRNISYQLAVNRLRAFAAQYHVYDGQVARDHGDLATALSEFQKAGALDPASSVAAQEIARTRDLQVQAASHPGADMQKLLMRPLQTKNKTDEELFATASPVPQLRILPAHPLPIVKVNNQPSTEVFLALCKAGGARVLFDGEYQPRPLGANQMLDFQGLSLTRALDYLSLVSKSYWKALSADTIFVSNDDPAKRGSYEDQVTKAFYLTNSPSIQDVNDVASTVQKITDIKKLFVHPEQNVIVARGDPDRIALAEKIIADLDKPKAEIIIDVIILSVSKNWSQSLGVNLALDGTGAVFAPRSLLTGQAAGSAVTGASGAAAIPLSALRHLSTHDYNITLPSATLNALLQISGTKLLDKAELRTVEGQKSTLNIGQKYPYATGSFLAGSAATSTSLVNTQYQFLDIGLNIAVTAKVHEPDEVSLHIESDTSSVDSTLNIGNIQQPIVSQRKRVADVRVKEGEINFWDIVTQRTESRDKNGVPFLGSIPWLGRAFSSERTQENEQEVLTLLVPHIIRAPDIRQVNLMELSSGTDQVVRMRYQSPELVPAPTKEPATVLELSPGNAGAATNPATTVPVVRPAEIPAAPAGPVVKAGNTRLFFNPAKVQAKAGAPFTVELTLVDPGSLGDSLTMVQFDPEALKLTSFTAGPALSANGANGLPGQKLEDGTVMLKFGREAAAGGVLGRFTFEPAKAGATSIQIAGSRLVSTTGEIVPAKNESLDVAVQ